LNKIAVIDYDAGNTMSVMNALHFLDKDVILTRDKEVLLNCDRIIFPGVGAYADAMDKLREYCLTDTIYELAAIGKPFLGICLGMQLLFDSSTETIGRSSAEPVRGLGILSGTIQHFSDAKEAVKGLKIPHMGWNSINLKKKNSKLFRDIDQNSYVYFVHSYYLNAQCRDDVAAVSEYGVKFDCAVENGNIFGCQFHPEKSGKVGMKILDNFCSL